MITGSEMAVVDENAEALGVPRKQLMESSGNAVARVVRDLTALGDSIFIVGGRGNNGGDAFVAARFLPEYDVEVALLGRPESIGTDIARENWAALQESEHATGRIRDSTDAKVPDVDVVVDAMLGTGISGDLREPVSSVAAAINRSDATVVSVDVPSGLDGDSGTLAPNAVDPDHVVTFHDSKPGLSSLQATVHVANIGIPEAAERFVGRGDLQRLHRAAGSHKGDNGDVLVVGGGPYSGAPAHAALAAYRAGADLVRVLVPERIRGELQGYSADLIVRGYEGDRFDADVLGGAHELAADADVTVLGPGIGEDERTSGAVAQFLETYDGTAVVDADALEVVPGVDTDATLLCTPHQGELVEMGGETSDDPRERATLVEEFADELDHTLLVKGAYDVISDGNTTRINRTGNPGMTVGGTGDVLAGVSGALAAVMPVQHAGAVAAYATGRAGDTVSESKGYGLTASDVREAVPRTLWPAGK